MASADIHIAIDFEALKEAVSDKVDNFVSFSQNPHLKKAIAIDFAVGCDPYVPYDTGVLAKTYKVTNAGVIKYAPVADNRFHYAEYVWNGINTHPNAVRPYLRYTKTTHPLAGGNWLNRFTHSADYDVFLEGVAHKLEKGWN